MLWSTKKSTFGFSKNSSEEFLKTKVQSSFFLEGACWCGLWLQWNQISSIKSPAICWSRALESKKVSPLWASLKALKCCSFITSKFKVLTPPQKKSFYFFPHFPYFAFLRFLDVDFWFWPVYLVFDLQRQDFKCRFFDVFTYILNGMEGGTDKKFSIKVSSKSLHINAVTPTKKSIIFSISIQYHSSSFLDICVFILQYRTQQMQLDGRKYF